MKNKLHGWKLIEGSIGMLETRNPSVSEVVAALEAISPEMIDPFMILEARASGKGGYPNYCQAFADEAGYVCEIRTHAGNGFRHCRSFLRDAQGNLGETDDPQFPNLSQAIRIFMQFIGDPDAFPVVEPVEWLDVSEEFEPEPA
jgi:hypothetical protein